MLDNMAQKLLKLQIYYQIIQQKMQSRNQKLIKLSPITQYKKELIYGVYFQVPKTPQSAMTTNQFLIIKQHMYALFILLFYHAPPGHRKHTIKIIQKGINEIKTMLNKVPDFRNCFNKEGKNINQSYSNEENIYDEMAFREDKKSVLTYLLFCLEYTKKQLSEAEVHKHKFHNEQQRTRIRRAFQILFQRFHSSLNRWKMNMLDFANMAASFLSLKLSIIEGFSFQMIEFIGEQFQKCYPEISVFVEVDMKNHIYRYIKQEKSKQKILNSEFNKIMNPLLLKSIDRETQIAITKPVRQPEQEFEQSFEVSEQVDRSPTSLLYRKSSSIKESVVVSQEIKKSAISNSLFKTGQEQQYGMQESQVIQNINESFYNPNLNIIKSKSKANQSRRQAKHEDNKKIDHDISANKASNLSPHIVRKGKSCQQNIKTSPNQQQYQIKISLPQKFSSTQEEQAPKALSRKPSKQSSLLGQEQMDKILREDHQESPEMDIIIQTTSQNLKVTNDNPVNLADQSQVSFLQCESEQDGESYEQHSSVEDVVANLDKSVHSDKSKKYQKCDHNHEKRVVIEGDKIYVKKSIEHLKSQINKIERENFNLSQAFRLINKQMKLLAQQNESTKKTNQKQKASTIASENTQKYQSSQTLNIQQHENEVKNDVKNEVTNNIQQAQSNPIHKKVNKSSKNSNIDSIEYLNIHQNKPNNEVKEEEMSPGRQQVNPALLENKMLTTTIFSDEKAQTGVMHTGGLKSQFKKVEHKKLNNHEALPKMGEFQVNIKALEKNKNDPHFFPDNDYFPRQEDKEYLTPTQKQNEEKAQHKHQTEKVIKKYETGSPYTEQSMGTLSVKTINSSPYFDSPTDDRLIVTGVQPTDRNQRTSILFRSIDKSEKCIRVDSKSPGVNVFKYSGNMNVKFGNK